MDLYEDIGLHSTLIEAKSNVIFSSAVQITRPMSSSKQGSSSLTNSPVNQIKVAKLVLKPASVSISNKVINKPSSPLKLQNNTRSPLLPSNQISAELPLMRKQQETVELEMKMRKVEKEKKALNEQTEIAAHKSTIDETMRHQAREYMKKQREKRKLETKKEVDKTFVIKQRLDELRKTTRNVICKKAKKSSVKISPPSEYYSMKNAGMKEIKVLKLKPMKMGREVMLEVTQSLELSEKVEESSPEKQSSPEKPALNLGPKPAWIPIKKPVTAAANQQKPAVIPEKSPAKPFQPQNRQNITKPQPAPRPTSAKENQNPRYDSLKLKVPDVKLSMSTINRTEIGHQSHQIPFWLQDSAIQPYPYNFIWAVRKKLEAYTSKDAERKLAHQKTQALMNFETPHLKKASKVKKSRKFPEYFSDKNESKHELQRPTIVDDSETNLTSLENELASEANTISEISSIKTEVKSQPEDDTTISESVFHSLKDDAFVGKKRESVNSEFDRVSFGKKPELEENVSPNTSEKRDNFLSSTGQNDFDNNKINREKEEEYQKMLQAFNQSLSHVIEVNQQLVLTSKSSSIVSLNAKNYSSSFENNVESEARKSSDISEMIENLVQQSKPAVIPVAEVQSDSNSSIPTFIEDSTMKPGRDNTIEDPPIAYVEPAQEFSSDTTKATEVVQRKEQQENLTILNIFKHSEAENSLNITFADNNTSFGILMDKSSSEIKSWERKLIERTRGQIAWLELQKQNFRKHGQLEKVSTVKKQQRAILLRLEKERTKLREGTEKVDENAEKSLAVYEKSIDLTVNEQEARDHIERILIEREEKINKRRAQVEHLVKWQRKLDKEEEKLKKMEEELLGENMKKLSSPRKKKKFDDVLNVSIEMVKSIDKSLKILDNIKPSEGEELVDVTGGKLNKLWLRLTGDNDEKYEAVATYHLTKEDFAQFYEDAKEFVLQSDLKMLLETSVFNEKKREVVTSVDDVTSPEVVVPEKANETFTTQQAAMMQQHNTSVANVTVLSQRVTTFPSAPPKPISPSTSDDEVSNVSTMNSIANIETEEEFPGSYPETFMQQTSSTTENDDELQQMLANQMKVFIDQKKPTAIESPTIDNATFQVRPKTPEDSSASSDMDIERDSLIQTEPLISIDNSAVDEDGSIIPEVSEILITDMDDEADADAEAIEDISFPDFDVSIAEQHNDSGNRNDLSTITECTEYEQSQGSCSEEISSEVASSATTSERLNSEIEKRLISINDSLEEVNLAFKKAITNRSPSTVTYSTDKDFIDTPKASSSESYKSDAMNLLSFSPSESSSTSKASGSQIATSTPKILMPDILSEVSGEMKSSETTEDF